MYLQMGKFMTNHIFYDSCWCHYYFPVIINSLKLINQDGLIMCDDVFKEKVNSDRIYNSTAAFETLVELKKENIIDLELIYKRLDAENNCDEKNRKLVAIFKKLKIINHAHQKQD